ncbi:uncharacterized protein LOC142803339 isoform X1 [Rhipicephalus microplus]|uniref:uncharacterized protein LOC142803339 isoform X1 n=1 Tax=Rhipicephalus microplus TaxID=6941 RepID=UPI003F6AFA23
MGLAAPRRSKEVLRLVDTFKQLRSRRDKEWKTMFTLGLLAVLPGVVSFLLLGIFLQYAKSRDDTTRPASELPGLYAHLGPGSDMTRPSSSIPEPLTTPAPATNERFSPSHYLRPQRSSREGVCSNTLCRFVAQWLRSKIDNFKEPCKDFYAYVCATHRGHSQLRQIAATLHQQNQQFLMKQKVPRTHQLSWQKAAGLLQTCISFVKSNRTEWRLICYKP